MLAPIHFAGAAVSALVEKGDETGAWKTQLTGYCLNLYEKLDDQETVRFRG
jgi:hypothetical protein